MGMPDGGYAGALTTRVGAPGMAQVAQSECASAGTMAPLATASSTSRQDNCTRTVGKNTSSTWVASQWDVSSPMEMVSGLSRVMAAEGKTAAVRW